MLLKNKIAIVTGSGRGIGQGIAIALAKEGCNVVVSDLNEKDCANTSKEVEKLGAKSLIVKCDVSSKSDVENLVKSAVKKFGKLDILVNNAGIFPFVPFIQMSEGDWDKVLNVNLKSVFICSQSAAKEMKNGGKIISISSIAAFVGFEGLAHYCASKGGINAMTRTIALELAPQKINVNAIAPGAIDTPGAKMVDENQIKQIEAVIPWKRRGLPEDIANAVVFLASDKSDYITGQTIIVDGGYTLR